jgi:large subunit ribosomal protein L35Ae
MSDEELFGVIINYKRGPKTQRNTNLIIHIPGIVSAKKASQFIGRGVECQISRKVLKGKVLRSHGNRGNVLVSFKSGLPGQILGSRVTIKERKIL